MPRLQTTLIASLSLAGLVVAASGVAVAEDPGYARISDMKNVLPLPPAPAAENVSKFDETVRSSTAPASRKATASKQDQALEPIPENQPIHQTSADYPSGPGDSNSIREHWRKSRLYGWCPFDGGCTHSPDYGWRRPVKYPIRRVPVQYHRYWPTRWYGEAGTVPPVQTNRRFPMVHTPTDTTQLGYYYQRVPVWRPNPAMIPPAPWPTQWHHREHFTPAYALRPVENVYYGPEGDIIDGEVVEDVEVEAAAPSDDAADADAEGYEELPSSESDPTASIEYYELPAEAGDEEPMIVEYDDEQIIVEYDGEPADGEIQDWPPTVGGPESTELSDGWMEFIEFSEVPADNGQWDSIVQQIDEPSPSKTVNQKADEDGVPIEKYEFSNPPNKVGYELTNPYHKSQPLQPPDPATVRPVSY